MPYKNKADANAAARRRWKENPEARRKQKSATQKWQDDNKERWNDYRNKWMKTDRDENIEVRRAYEFAREMKKYGKSIEWYRDKLVEQLGVCAMCGHFNHSQRGELHRLQVDHDHGCCDKRTHSCGECVRGLICEKCNLRLAPIELLLSEFPFERQDQAEIYLRNSVRQDSWTYRALKYLKQYTA